VETRINCHGLRMRVEDFPRRHQRRDQGPYLRVTVYFFETLAKKEGNVYINLMTSLEASLCLKRQPVSNEREQDLTLFFGRFLNTPVEMDAHSGFKGSHQRAPRVLEA
jgi:hypothetical protein